MTDRPTQSLSKSESGDLLVLCVLRSKEQKKKMKWGPRENYDQGWMGTTDRRPRPIGSSWGESWRSSVGADKERARQREREASKKRGYCSQLRSCKEYQRGIDVSLLAYWVNPRHRRGGGGGEVERSVAAGGGTDDYCTERHLPFVCVHRSVVSAALARSKRVVGLVGLGWVEGFGIQGAAETTCEDYNTDVDWLSAVLLLLLLPLLLWEADRKVNRALSPSFEVIFER